MTCTDPETLAAPSDGLRAREVLGCFATGVAVVTTLGDGNRPVGLTVNSFNSVSLEPPLILWSIARTAPSFDAFRRSPAFTVNILSEDQHHLCRHFATPAADKFAGVEHVAGYLGVPRLAGTVAHLECVTHDRFPGGDHLIILGRIVAMAASDRAPLVFHRGRLGRLHAGSG